jgi:hypothetical protein
LTAATWVEPREELLHGWGSWPIGHWQDRRTLSRSKRALISPVRSFEHGRAAALCIKNYAVNPINSECWRTSDLEMQRTQVRHHAMSEKCRNQCRRPDGRRMREGACQRSRPSPERLIRPPKSAAARALTEVQDTNLIPNVLPRRQTTSHCLGRRGTSASSKRVPISAATSMTTLAPF